MEDFRQTRPSRRRQSEGTTARHTFEPPQLQKTMQNHSADESLEVITALCPVEARLAEYPPRPRLQIGAERGKEARARSRDLAALVGERDVPHGHKRVGNSDAC